jgi:flavodoxin
VETEEKVLVVYYSRTGKTKVVSDTLKNYFCADELEVKDLKDRSGVVGFLTAAYDSFFDKYTSIEPAHPDLSRYSFIILVSPVWNWKLSMPMRTFLHNNKLNGKKLLVFTTANIDIKKYEQYGNDAPFIKRYLKNYLRENSKKMRAEAAASGAKIMGHYHVETQDVSGEKIKEKTLASFQDVQKRFALKPCQTNRLAYNYY